MSDRDFHPCPDAPGDIEDLADGRLDAADESALLAHIETCATCREQWSDETALRSLADTLAPDGFAEDVMARIRAAPPPLRRVPPVRWVAAAAVLLVATIAILLGRGDGDDPRPPRPDDVIEVAAATASPSARSIDLARRARLFLAAVDDGPPEVLLAELRLSGLTEAINAADLADLPAPDRAAVRRVSLLGEAWQNDAPVARAEIAMLTEGIE